MKIIHLADLHLGKILHNASLSENGDQNYWIDRLLEFTDKYRPDAVIIAGDIYDRGIPPKEATVLLDRLLTGLAKDRDIPVMMIAGNHDGGERLSFASELMHNVTVSGVLSKELKHVTLEDSFGPVTFWLLPYLFPAAVRQVLGAESDEIPDYDTAVRKMLAIQNIDCSQRNVLIAHQFVVSGGSRPEQSESETSVGGIGAIDSSAFDAFDYVALGHIHGEQSIGRESVRYAGAPLCYHFSEVGQRKGILTVELSGKDEAPELELVPLPVMHPMRNVTGKLEEVLETESRTELRNEYVRVVLTDENPVYAAAETLRAVFESHGTKVLEFIFQPERRETKDGASPDGDCWEKSLQELFGEYYYSRKNRPLSSEDYGVICSLADEILNDSDRKDEDIVSDIVRLVCRQEADS